MDWLRLKHPSTPKTRAKQWIVAGRVSVNGRVIRRPHELICDPGEGLSLLDRQPISLDCGPGWQIHPRVALLYLDAAVAIVNKSPGLVSVPAPNCNLSALSILAGFLAGTSKAHIPGVTGKTLPPVYRRFQALAVHRLDQHTSGLLCIATHPVAQQHLIAQLKAHTIKREYVAFAEGRSATPTGTWHQWLKLSEDELRQQVVSGPPGKPGRSEVREAITHFEVIAEYPLAGDQGWITQLRLRLETGRKHQIRVQAANAGLPLIGDRIYNPKYRDQATLAPPIVFPRQALHAEMLTLEHPNEPGKRMSWKAELPKDLRQLEEALLARRR